MLHKDPAPIGSLARSLWSLSQLRVDDSVSGFDDCSSGREESSRTARHFVVFFFFCSWVRFSQSSSASMMTQSGPSGFAQTMRIWFPLPEP